MCILPLPPEQRDIDLPLTNAILMAEPSYEIETAHAELYLSQRLDGRTISGTFKPIRSMAVRPLFTP